MALTIVTPPAVEPVTLAEAKLHLRVDLDDDDAYITGLIIAARDYAETVTNRALVTQTWDLVLDGFPSENHIDVPMPRLQSVTHVKYYDTAGTDYTFAAASYIVDTDTEPGRVVLSYGESWPSTTLQPANGVKVRFVAGYGLAVAVPEEIKVAIKLILANMYENREPVVVGTIASKLPMAVDSLLSHHSVLEFPK